MMKKIGILICIMVINQAGFAHQLPQKIHPQIANNTIAIESMSFGEQEIGQWLQYADTLDISEIGEQVNIPGLISYKAATVTKANPEVECSIYLDQDDDKDGYFCGDIDRHAFMKAGLAAIGYCHYKRQELIKVNGSQKPLVPYFLAPNSFVSSMYETTHGAHHDNYEVTHGLQFHCVEAYIASEAASPIEDAQDL